MLESFYLALVMGFIQGVTEWLPISSSAMLSIVLIKLFNYQNIDIIIREVLFLHLGTFFAALIYFRKDIIYLIKSAVKYRSSKKDTRKIINFLVVSTLISGIVGIIFLKFLTNIQDYFSTKILIVLIGLFLIITGMMGLFVKSFSIKSYSDLSLFDGLLLGFVQGLSIIPGISRSGITVSALLLRKFDDHVSLKLSFIMSLPIVLAGNIILNYSKFSFNSFSVYALIFSFIFGILSISLLMNLAKKVNFGWFALVFGILMIISSFI